MADVPADDLPATLRWALHLQVTEENVVDALEKLPALAARMKYGIKGHFGQGNAVIPDAPGHPGWKRLTDVLGDARRFRGIPHRAFIAACELDSPRHRRGRVAKRWDVFEDDTGIFLKYNR